MVEELMRPPYKEGDRVPTVRMTFWLDAELYRKMKEHCGATGESLRGFMNRGVYLAVEEMDNFFSSEEAKNG